MSDVYPATPLGSPPASGPPAPPAATPGQAAYEAYMPIGLALGISSLAWHDMDAIGKRAWDAAAQAAIDSAHLPERLAKAVTALKADVAGLTVARDALGHDLTQARTAFARLAGYFTQGKQAGWTARVSGTVLRRLCVMAMCEPPDGTGLEALAEASDLITERDAHKLRADHYEGLWRAEHGLPPEGGVMDTAP